MTSVESSRLTVQNASVIGIGIALASVEECAVAGCANNVAWGQFAIGAGSGTVSSAWSGHALARLGEIEIVLAPGTVECGLARSSESSSTVARVLHESAVIAVSEGCVAFLALA